MLRHPGNGASQASIVVCVERVRRSSGRACRRIVSLSAVGEAWRKIWLVPTTFNPEPGYGPAYPRLVATIFCAEQILCPLSFGILHYQGHKLIRRYPVGASADWAKTFPVREPDRDPLPLSHIRHIRSEDGAVR